MPKLFCKSGGCVFYHTARVGRKKNIKSRFNAIGLQNQLEMIFPSRLYMVVSRKFIELLLSSCISIVNCTSGWYSFSSRVGHNHNTRHSHHTQRSYPFLRDELTTTMNNSQHNATYTRRYASIKYVPRITDNIVNRFRQLVPDVMMAQKPAWQMRSMFTPLKTKLNNLSKSGVVYKINCSDCDKA